MMKILNIPRDTHFDSPCLQRDNVSFLLILQSHSHYFVLLYFVLDPHSEIVRAYFWLCIQGPFLARL